MKMDLRKIILTSAIAISACAVPQKPVSLDPIKPHEVSISGSADIYIRYHNDAEEKYFIGSWNDGTKYCGLRITNKNSTYTLLEDKGCDDTVDVYTKGLSNSELENITRGENTDWFTSVVDPLFKEKKEEILK